MKHWNVYAWSVGAGLLVLLGALTGTQAAGTGKEQANKKLVLDFYAALNRAEAEGKIKASAPAIAEQYLRADYIQHSEMAAGLAKGREGFVRALDQAPDMPARPGFRAPETLAIMADGDLVIQVTRREIPDGKGGPPHPVYIFNMFRVQDGKLAEHWDGASASMGPAGPGGVPAPPKPKQ